MVQIQPGVKDIRTALANAITDGGEPYTDRSPTEGGMNDRQVCIFTTWIYSLYMLIARSH